MPSTLSVSDYQSFLSPKEDDKLDHDRELHEGEAIASPRTVYSNMRNARAQATFNLMMRMAPSALKAIRQEFYSRSDSVSLTEFIYIMSKHLLNDASARASNPDYRNFGSDMYELFKEVDVNGDGLMEWDEFTKFTVEKASSLNQNNMVMSSIPEYYDITQTLDNSAKAFRRGNITAMVPLLKSGLFAVLEEHRKSISIYQSSNGRLYNEIITDAVPLAVEPMKGHGAMAAVFADLTLSTYQIDDSSNSSVQQKRNALKATVSTPDVQMSMAWMSSNDLLYTGSANGNIYSWNMHQNQIVSTMTGHSDIVMNLLALDSLDSLMSASLDMTIGVWDTYTNTVIHKLKGHRKGVFSMSYNPDFRLLVSSGFDHEAFVWSPFVNSLVYKLKGHHSALVGCQCVENSPELITADEDGVFKLWDIRTFQCVQTFYNNSNSENEPAEHLSCFFNSKVSNDSESQAARTGDFDDSRLFAGSRRIRCFEQKRVVHSKTTDETNVVWADVNEASLTVITVSERNVVIWDLLLGSKIIVHNDMCGEEISACCLDNRKRKIIIGDVNGDIRVYNPLNGSYMKSCVRDMHSVVVSLAYVGHSRRFLAGYVNGMMRLYDESNLDDCQILRNFDCFNCHSELSSVSFLEVDRTLVSVGSLGDPVKLWEYDSGKCDMELQACEKTETIIAVVVLQPYPLIATADSVGNLSVWGSRGCKWRGDRITAFKNQHPLEAEMEAPLRTHGPRRILPEMRDIDDETLAEKSSVRSIGETRPSLHSFSFSETDSAAARAEEDLQECAKKWGPISAATALAWDPENCHFYTGDEQGTLRAFSLEGIIEELGGECMCHGKSSTASLKRKASGQTKSSLAGGSVIPHVSGKKRDVAKSAAVFRWGLVAHRETIICCRSSPHGILTSSTDNKVKMWTEHGLEVGSLLSCATSGQRSANWDLKLDIDGIMQQEGEVLDGILSAVERYTLDRREGSGGAEEPASDDKKTKFSRTSLRKRIEMSSRLLGLDFISEEGEDGSGSEATLLEDMSLGSSASKSTRNALDEARNIRKQSSSDDKKKQTLSVLQMRHKEVMMNKMVQSYEEKGISFPVLKPKESKDVDYGTIDLQPPNPVSPQKASFSSDHKRQENIRKKCNKYASFKLLEKSLASESLPPLTKEEREKQRQLRKDQIRQRELKETMKRMEKKKPTKIIAKESSSDGDLDEKEED